MRQIISPLLIGLFGLSTLAGCATSTSDSAETETEVTASPSATSPPATDSPQPTETTEATGEARAPYPSDEEAARIHEEVGRIYSPDVTANRALNWSRYLCADILAGELTELQLEERTIIRFSGGTREDPTLDQAQAILELVREGGWCV